MIVSLYFSSSNRKYLKVTQMDVAPFCDETKNRLITFVY